MTNEDVCKCQKHLQTKSPLIHSKICCITNCETNQKYFSLNTVGGTRIGPASIEMDHSVRGTTDDFSGLVKP